MKLPKGHLSHTQLRQFADCPRYWQAINLDGLEQPSTAPMRLGAGIHDLIARYLMGEDTDEAEVLAAYDLSPARASEAMDIYAEWLAGWADTGEGVPAGQMEDALTWGVPTSPPVEFTARLDFWLEDEGMPCIYDWKTDKRPPSDSEVAEENAPLWMQLLTYGVGFREQRKRADRYSLRLVYVRYNVMHERVVDNDGLDHHIKALTASCQAVLLAVQAGKFPARPGRACATCPLRKECDLATPLGEGANALAQTYLWHKARLAEFDEQLRSLAEAGDLPDEESGVFIGYKPSSSRRQQTRQVNREKQVLVRTEAGEELWGAPVTEEKVGARFGVYDLQRPVIAPSK